jgi:hypothetical protein
VTLVSVAQPSPTAAGAGRAAPERAPVAGPSRPTIDRFAPLTQSASFPLLAGLAPVVCLLGLTMAVQLGGLSALAAFLGRR